MLISLITFALLLPAVVCAANDWNTPCLNGQCSYDVSNSTADSTATGSLFINGSTSAISDLTPAAGWTILSCDANATAQDIQAICTGDNSTCSHLYNNGAVGTIVRLPDDCGKMPFARIASEWTHENQSVPEYVANKLRRRSDEAQPTVRGITLDTNFSKIDPSHHGHVSMFIQGAAGVPANLTTAPPPANITARSIEDRSFLSGIEHSISSTISGILRDMSFNEDKSLSKTIDVSKNTTVLDKSETCAVSGTSPSFTAGIAVSVDVTANADVTFGVVAQGTIVPPEMSSFGLFSNFDATLDGTLTIEALASISLSSGTITLFEAGLPGLDFPGILTLGPSFQLQAEATASITGDVSLSVDLAYSMSNGKLFFPPGAGSSSGTFAPAGTNLQLSAVPGVAMEGSLVAHVIPSLVFGINALDGLADVDVTLGLDAHAELDLTLSKSSNSQFSGCTDVTTGLADVASADGSFFDLFSKSTTVTLYQKNFELFQKCFAAKREHAREIIGTSPAIVKRGITCSGNGSSNKTSVVSELMSATQVEST